MAIGGWTNGKGPIKIVKNIPQGMPPFTAQYWAPIAQLQKLLPLALIVMAVDMLESTSIARALARKNGYGKDHGGEGSNQLQPAMQHMILRYSSISPVVRLNWLLVVFQALSKMTLN